MDDTATDAPAPAPVAEPTLAETLLQRLADATAPLTLKELAKGLKPPKVKADQFEQALLGYLGDGLRTGRVYKHGSGKAGADRYWSRDEKRAIREAALGAASTPMAVADLVKKAVAETKSDKDFAEGVVRDLIGEDKLFEHPPKKKDGPLRFGVAKAPPPPVPKNDPEKVRAALLEAAETPQTLTKLVGAAVAATGADKTFVKAEGEKLVQDGQLHEHPGKGPPYGRQKPPPTKNNPEKVRAALLEAAEPPQTLTRLVDAAVAATGADKKFVKDEAEKLVEDGQLHKHPGKGTPYGRQPPPPPPDPEKVRAAVLEAAETPQPLADLIEATSAATGADKKFVKGEVDNLLEAKQLHQHGTAKSAPYGRSPPKQIHPLDEGKGKKGFEKLVGTARGLLDSVKNVPTAELLDRLRLALADELPKLPGKEQPVEVTGSVTTLVGSPKTPEPKSATEPLTPERVRTGLKAAYDELCLDPEFEDKLVEIRRLYHEAVRNLRGLTVEQFHRELEHLQRQRVVELHALNEVQRAKERELAILRNDRLLYYIIWSKT